MGNSLDSFSSDASKSPNHYQCVNSKDAVADRIEKPIVEVLASFFQDRLGVEPKVENLRHIWECSWEDRAGEISIFLHADNPDSFHLQLFYIWKIGIPSVKTLQPAEIKRLCRLLEERTGLRVVTRS